MGLSVSKSPSEAPRTTHTSRRMQVFVQFHIPKTGGESVNSWFRLHAPSNRYLRVQSEKDFNAALGTVQQALANSNSTNSTRIYIEVHAGTAPSWQSLQGPSGRLHALRRQPGLELTTFTVLREPISWVISAYNYVCGGVQHEKACSAGRHDVASMSRTLRSNPQCAYLLYGWSGWTLSPGPSPSEELCSTVLSSLRHNMDFVGHSDCLDAIFSWLSSRMQLGAVLHPNSSDLHTNEGPGHYRTPVGWEPVTAGQLTFTVSERLRNLTWLDHRMYNAFSSKACSPTVRLR